MASATRPPRFFRRRRWRQARHGMPKRGAIVAAEGAGCAGASCAGCRQRPALSVSGFQASFILIFATGRCRMSPQEVRSGNPGGDQGAILPLLITLAVGISICGECCHACGQGPMRHDSAPTPARCAMPVLPQRWLGFRQAEGVPRRPISLHGSDTLQRARPSPSRGPWRVRSLGRGAKWALVVLD